MSTPNRHERRALARRADRMISALVGQVVAVDPYASVALVREDGVTVLDDDDAATRLGDLGLDSMWSELLAVRARRPGHLACVVIIAKWAQVSFLKAHQLSRGGVA